MIKPNSNFLAEMPTAVQELIQPHLVELHLEREEVVARAYVTLETAYFPIDCVLSVDIETGDGNTFCTGLIANDGLLGAGMSLDERVCLYTVSALVGGRAYSMPMQRLRDLLLEIPEFRKKALAYDQFFLAQVQQTAACSALHELPERLSMWLLRLHGYAGSELHLTQSALAQMLGVRRTTITEGAQALQRAGAIEYRRGEISILNPGKMQQLACGCGNEISSHFSRLFADEASAAEA